MFQNYIYLEICIYLKIPFVIGYLQNRNKCEGGIRNLQT